MFLTVDDRKEINKRAKHIPDIYVKEMIKIFDEVINREPIYVQPTILTITADDYD